MASRVCMNISCGATAATDWRKGWGLRFGGYANLCDKCGSAYEQLSFCHTFHLTETGWRECRTCGKRLHCGCIASKSLVVLLDTGGVECINCSNRLEFPSTSGELHRGHVLNSSSNILNLSPQSPKDGEACEVLTPGVACEHVSTAADLKVEDNDILGDNHGVGPVKKEQVGLPITDVVVTSYSNSSQLPIGLYQDGKMDGSNEHETHGRSCLKISLGNANTNHKVSIPGMIMDGKDVKKMVPSFQPAQKARHLLPKPQKAAPLINPDSAKEMTTPIRIARPPGEGRGRNQLLPRYWPRITDQELRQISGDSNSTIVPLFEKVLSASDAGRIGRLVLPKACAEAYFPPISQPEGLPLKIQDAKGKDWVFQFRFWPNNNSRMYVLEGVTPCIQSMQLQAGDTVTFSRIEPEGKLVMGFRKASNLVARQDAHIPAVSNGTLPKEPFLSGVIENLPVINGYSGLFQSLKGSVDPHLSALSEHMNFSDGDNCSWLRSDKQNGRAFDGFPAQYSLPGLERKRSRNIGSKSKRLVMDTEEALELKLTWEEAQDLLRPPPSIQPSIVMIENYELEEYEEPPVFGKRTIFTIRSSGAQDQWVQCDSCHKWRRLPVDALIQSKWTCVDNAWDPKGCSCSAPDEISRSELENLFRIHLDIKRRKIGGSHKPGRIHEPQSGLDALASVAVLGDDGSTTPQGGPTTKHPRHRPGCMCIVCIQPPSGKGPKHKPTCTCNVCMTVKRRFKTLMMRKKKKQMDKEAETTSKKDWGREEADADTSSRWDESQSTQSKAFIDRAELSMIDLNCHPDWEEDNSAVSGRMSMMSLLQVASLPLETYLKEHGLRSLITEQPGSSVSLVLPPGTGESEGQDMDGSYFSSSGREEGNGDALHDRAGLESV